MEETSIYELQQKKVKQIAISKVLPGMITAKDVYSRNEQLILNKETKLDANTIAKIMFYAVESIYVYELSEGTSKKKLYTEQLRNSIEFRNFKKDYDASVLSIRNTMNAVIEKNEKIDKDKLLKDVNQIIANVNSKTDVFHMLHCIREYDDITYVHSVNVALICNIFAEWLGMTRLEKETLTICGLLHDIGKLTIPKSIIDKPQKLTSEEFEIMKLHTVRGYDILKDMDLDDSIKQAVLLHHERCNGEGYPFHKTGEEISSYAMLTAIADVYDAMTSNRIYRPGACPFTAIEEFEDAKQLYSPRYLFPLLERIAETYIRHTVRLSSDQEGEIVMLNKDFLARPLVRIENEFVDLSKQKDIKIDAIL